MTSIKLFQYEQSLYLLWQREIFTFLTSPYAFHIAGSFFDDHTFFGRLHIVNHKQLFYLSAHCFYFSNCLFFELVQIAFAPLVSYLWSSSIQLFQESPDKYAHNFIIFVFA
jgi:hypothetical protein